MKLFPSALALWFLLNFLLLLVILVILFVQVFCFVLHFVTALFLFFVLLLWLKVVELFDFLFEVVRNGRRVDHVDEDVVRVAVDI